MKPDGKAKAEHDPARVTRNLLAWYEKGHRALPWRDDPSPYHVWLSEIMLQQTRVEAVRGYYERFLAEIPDIAALANAPQERLLKLWEGLGYYSRVRNLRRAAEIVMETYGGTLPAETGELKRLPGIGDYTASAIASIAFGRRAAAVDGNVLRVMARLRADKRDIARDDIKRAVREELEAGYLPEDDARCGTFNQALMELGAVICVPNGVPLCGDCPVQTECLAAKNGIQAEFPVKQGKKERRTENRTVLLLCDRTRVALEKRPEKGLLAGMYEYPSVPGHLELQEVRRYLKRERIPALRIRRLPDAKHVFTHIEWHMRGYLVYTEELEEERFLAANRADVERVYAIPSAYAAYTKAVKELLPS